MTRYLLGAVVRLWHRAFTGGIDKWKRGEARSIAAAAAPLHGDDLSEEDLELVNAHHEILLEWRQTTDEHPLVQPVRRSSCYRKPARWQRVAARRSTLHSFTADPLAADIPGRHRVEEPVLFGDAVQRWFTPALTAAPTFPDPPAEPEPWHIDSFTDQWTAADVARMVAEAKAEASR